MAQIKEKVCVRFAPSPTGFLHIGSLRTALFNWLFAKKNKGKFILRIEDTDRERYIKGAVENIIEALKWYGLDFDEGPIFQSKRLEIYKKYANQLVKKGKAYFCFCPPARLEKLRRLQIANKQAPRYDGHCCTLSEKEVRNKLASKEPYVIRLKVPEEGSTEFDDIIYGHIIVENKNIDDQVLLKSDGYPTYHLANVVDDHEQGITHIIRAEEWLPSVPKHILLYQAFGWSPPRLAHLPMVLGKDRSKLSKRHGAVAALEYKKLGYLPEAVINFIALLGWNPKTNQEIFSRDELIQNFDLNKINKASAFFDLEKLDWFNGYYIRKIKLEKLVDLCLPFIIDQKVDKIYLKKVISLFQERMKRLVEINYLADFFFKNKIKYNTKILIPKRSEKDLILITLVATFNFIKGIKIGDFKAAKLKYLFEKFIQKNNFNNTVVLWPLRVAITGKEASPGVFEVMEVLGKEKVLARVEGAVENLKKL